MIISENDKLTQTEPKISHKDNKKSIELSFINTLFALFNANTNTYDVGAPQKDSSDLAEGGAVSREYS